MHRQKSIRGNEIIIRRALPADLAGLVLLLKVLFGIEEDFTFDEPLQRRGLAMMLENPLGCILVAEAEGEVVGMCSGQLTVSTAEGGPSLLVEDVVVREEYRGMGIGSRLMEQIGLWAGDKGATRLQLLADRNNLPALTFYEMLGWQTTQLICLRKRK